MSDNSDNDYLSDADVEEEEDEEEEVLIHKKGIKSIIPHSFGSTVENQHIIGDPVEEYGSDEEDEKDQLEKSHTAKSAKGRKRRTKKTDEENDSDYEPEHYESNSDDDSDVDEAEEEGLEEGEYEEDDVEDNEEEDEQERYMHHFDKEINKEYILETHPECIPVNMAEVRAMLNVVRNKDGVIIDDFHKTIPFVTKYEKARIIGQRAMQLDSGATPYINTEFLIDGVSIAEREFEEKKIPVIIKRPLPNGAFEYWRLRDLEILY
jgi:DNA-directed RNA polymerase I, II, and III subunit RPABC2